MTPDRPQRTLRIFLLDDHELLRRGVRGLLEGAPEIEVVGESGLAGEGTRRILALRPDVAVVDVQLPDGSGIDVCREIRSRDSSIHVLMLTTYDDARARMASLLAGAAGFVLKEIRGQDLVAAVRMAATGQSLPDAAPEPQDLARHLGDPRLQSLTCQETRVLELIVEGLTNREIGDRLAISEKTVRNHVTNLLGKLGLSRRTQAAVYALTSETDADPWAMPPTKTERIIRRPPSSGGR